MERFDWNQRFVTGLENIDTQHHRLIDMINEVGALQSGPQPTEQKLQDIFKTLIDYARYHFSEEERQMAAARLDARYVRQHHMRHIHFGEQVTLMWRSRAALDNAIETLHGFLVMWLSFHILEEDQAMARQITAVRSGIAPEAAYLAEQGREGNKARALLDALDKLLHVMATQYRNMADTNLLLERRVSERTRELESSNRRLAEEQQKLAELIQKMAAAQSQLLQSEKMAAIGQLAAGVAHEINNPIGFVNSNLGTLKGYVTHLLGMIDAYEKCETSHAIHSEQLIAAKQAIDLDYLRTDIVALVDESREGLDRVKKIVQGLKDFSRSSDIEAWTVEDIHKGLETTLNVVWNELKYKCDVRKEFGVLPPIECVLPQLNQVFMNLLVNAAQAIETHGTITLRTGCADDEVWVEIGDTGKGIPAEHLDHIFDPFFTTKPVGTGTGLGLSVSHGIVERHHGRMSVRSAIGEGSVFRISLPLRQPQGNTATADLPAAAGSAS